MAFFNLPSTFGRLQGVALSYPFRMAFGNDQPDVFVVDNESGDEIFAGATPLGTSTNPTSTVMSHPAETGFSFADHRILEPLELSLRLLLPKAQYRDVYSEMRTYFDNGLLVKVHTRTRVCRNMAIVSMPDELDAETFDAITVELALREMIFVTPSQGTMTEENTRAKVNANTVQQGQKSPGGLITAVNENAQQEALSRRLRGGR